MKVLILSGAGLSAGAGIPTFRDAGGLYSTLIEGETPESVLSAAGYRRNPERVEHFLDALRVRVGESEPSAAHRECAAIEREFPGTVHCTQNVDDLLERAGAQSVVHLHGRIHVLRCLGQRHELEIRYTLPAELRCPACGSRLRSDVVLFEEPAPEYARLYRELERLGPDDAFVVIGTHGTVLPVALLAGATPALKILNILAPSAYIPDDAFDLALYRPADEAVREIRDALAAWRDRPTADSTRG